MHKGGYTNLAVLDGKKCVGNVTEMLLRQALHPDGNVAQLVADLTQNYIESDEDVLTAIPIFESTAFTCLPVINEAGEWQGYLEKSVLANVLLDSGFNSPNGGILYLPFHTQHDSLSRIARIIEENSGLITRTTLLKRDGLPELIVQIQTAQFAAIVQGLERHGVIIEKAFQFGITNAGDTSRFDLLLKYLNP